MFVDIFRKGTEQKQADLKTNEFNIVYSSFLIEMKNFFIEKLKNYERKALDTQITKENLGKLAGA